MLPKLLLLPCLTALALTTPGCLMTITEPALRVDYEAPVAVEYRPLRYDGFIVYYADDGIPYYLRGGRRYWVPRHARARYISHWRSYKPAYRDWYRQHRPDRPQQWRGDDRRNDRPRDNNRRDDRPRRDDSKPWYRDRSRFGDNRPADTQSPVAATPQSPDQAPAPWYRNRDRDQNRRDDNRPVDTQSPVAATPQSPDQAPAPWYRNQNRRDASRPVTQESQREIPAALPSEQVAVHSRSRSPFPQQRVDSEISTPSVRTDRRGEPELNEAIGRRRQQVEPETSAALVSERRSQLEMAANRQRQQEQQQKYAEMQQARQRQQVEPETSAALVSERRSQLEMAANRQRQQEQQQKYAEMQQARQRQQVEPESPATERRNQQAAAQPMQRVSREQERAAVSEAAKKHAETLDEDAQSE